MTKSTASRDAAASQDAAALALQLDPQKLGVIVVDHGSRREESNRRLLEMARLFAEQTGYSVVEPAHMELAEPSIATAFDRCVARGAKVVVVSPFFLLPGRHWQQDIPALAAAAAGRHPDVRYLVAAPLGLHPLMARIMQDRIEHCLRRAAGLADACSICAGGADCGWRSEAGGSEGDS